MANVTQDLGIVTAYGAAVRGGYTGSYDDFCRQQAGYAESAAAVEAAKAAAEAAAAGAATSETNAAASETAAAGSAESAAGSAAQVAGEAAQIAQNTADITDLKADLNKTTPVVSHFYTTGNEPVIDTQNRTITFMRNCPFVVHGKPYGNSKNTSTVINIPPHEGGGTAYYILYLDLTKSSVYDLVFHIQRYNVAIGENWAYVGQINIQSMIFSFPFNVNIDGTLYYALGKDVYSLVDAFEAQCEFQKYTGGYVKASDGGIGSNSSTGYTSYIDVSAFSKIISPIDHVQTYQMAFYDADKSYVSGKTTTPTAPVVWEINVPNNAKYARLSFYLDVESSFYVTGTINNISAYVKSVTENKLRGKKLGIIGDSISTFSGYIPSGYTTFYPRNTVTTVDKTWWNQLLVETGMTLCVNASWSGSTIAGDTTRTDGYVGCSDARVNALTDGSGNKPDIIIVWMGINDFGKTNGITCGTYDGTTAVSTATNITAITEAYGVLLKKLETTYPDAQIFVCRILPEQFASEMAASFANGFPDINPNDNVSLPELNEYIEKIANAFGCGVIPMDKCGATFFNINTYTGDGLHPNALLTPKMCEVAKQTLLSLVN